ncbi:hypothetical protein BGZ54_001021 [Gamsiella multidivaricata]|nr:hypothetical protein BGZ54_001021 [Gamsiella multidivaricata]
MGYFNLVKSQLMTPQILSAVIDMNNIQANFIFAPLAAGGAQVLVNVQKGLSQSFAISPTGGFEYHIHVSPVGLNNNCSTTGGHLDPTDVGTAKCNPAKADKCQEGDLSGKHGELKATESGSVPTISYVDPYLQFSEEATTIAGRSIVIHNNGTRVACANILPVGGTQGSSSGFTTMSLGSQTVSDGPDVKASQRTNNSSRIVARWNVAIVTAGAVATSLWRLLCYLNSE